MAHNNTKQISLNGRGFALVDASDYEWLSARKWCLLKSGYAQATWNSKRVYMHRIIMDAPKGTDVDHINGIYTDNRRANLRLCTRSQNKANQKVQKNSMSGYKGVFKKNKTRWGAVISRGGKKELLGSFASPEEAAAAYDIAAIRLFGEFAKPNFPKGNST